MRALLLVLAGLLSARASAPVGAPSTSAQKAEFLRLVHMDSCVSARQAATGIAMEPGIKQCQCQFEVTADVLTADELDIAIRALQRRATAAEIQSVSLSSERALPERRRRCGF